MEYDSNNGKFILDNADRHTLGLNRFAVEPGEAGIIIDAAYNLLQRSSDTQLAFTRPGGEREELRRELQERRGYAQGILDMVEPYVAISEADYDQLLFDSGA